MKQLGVTSYRPGQRALIQAAMGGRDALGILPTGGGKSLCFQAPALVDGRTDFPSGRHGLAVVVSPLISLMKDQVDGLRVDGVAAAYLNSSQTAAERDEVVDALRGDRCRLLYVSPERLVGAARDTGLPGMITPAFAATAQLLLARRQTEQARALLRELDQIDARVDPDYAALLPSLVRVALADGRSMRALVSEHARAFVVPARESKRDVLVAYLRLGTEHLAFGLDHLLFVLGLFLLVGGGNPLLAAQDQRHVLSERKGHFL